MEIVATAIDVSAEILDGFEYDALIDDGLVPVDVGDESWLLGCRGIHGWSRPACEDDEPSLEHRGRSALEHAQKTAGRAQGPGGPSIAGRGRAAFVALLRADRRGRAVRRR